MQGVQIEIYEKKMAAVAILDPILERPKKVRVDGFFLKKYKWPFFQLYKKFQT